jgi:hypothetical protein
MREGFRNSQESVGRLCGGFFPLFVLTCLLSLSGCSTEREWNSRIGNYTYDEMVSDYGAALTATKSADGTIAQWVVYREREHGEDRHEASNFHHRPHRRSGPIWKTDYLYEMTFDSEGRLRSWRKIQP